MVYVNSAHCAKFHFHDGRRETFSPSCCGQLRSAECRVRIIKNVCRFHTEKPTINARCHARKRKHEASGYRMKPQYSSSDLVVDGKGYQTSIGSSGEYPFGLQCHPFTSRSVSICYPITAIGSFPKGHRVNSLTPPIWRCYRRVLAVIYQKPTNPPPLIAIFPADGVTRHPVNCTHLRFRW